MEMQQQPEELFTYKEVRLEHLNAEQMKAFVGDYYSEELDVTYRIMLKEDQLHLQQKNPHKPNPSGALTPKLKNICAVGRLLLKFDHDDQGDVTSFTVNAGRVKNIRFEKKSFFVEK